MITRRPLNWTSLFLGFAVITAACSKSEDSPSPSPAPAAAPAASQANASAAPSAPGLVNQGSQAAPGGQNGPVVQSSPVITQAPGPVPQAAPTPVPAPTPVTGPSGSTQVGGLVLVPPPAVAAGPLKLPASGPQQFNIGINYTLGLPKNMHLTEYASTAGTNGLSVIRIASQDDPFYPVNYSCDHTYDSLFLSSDQEGNNYHYCNTSLTGPGGPGAKWLLGYFMAPNHIEIATDADDVTPTYHTILDVDVFSTVQPFKQGQSRFDFYCGNSGNTGITTTSVPMQYSFFYVPEAVPVAACTTPLQLAPNGGLPTASNNVWVVSFFVDNSGFQVSCYNNPSTPSCTSFTSTTMTEVTVIIAGNGSTGFTLPADAIHYAQNLLFFPLPLLQSINPQN